MELVSSLAFAAREGKSISHVLLEEPETSSARLTLSLLVKAP